MKYVALLRAVNVSGTNIIKMEALRHALNIPGMKHVTTYIQSGNIVFDAQGDAAIWEKKIAKLIHKEFGHEVDVLVRSAEELQKIVDNNPFGPDVKGKLTTYITFMAATPDAEKAAAVEALGNDVESFKIVGRECYAQVVKDTDKKSLFSNMFIEKKLGVRATGRNITTCNKLLELAAK